MGDRLDLSLCVKEAAKELGYPMMKQEQLEIVMAFVQGSDVFAILPTGFGKSKKAPPAHFRLSFSVTVTENQVNINILCKLFILH